MERVVEWVAARLPRRLAATWRLFTRTALSSWEDRVHGLAAEAAFFTLLSLPALLLSLLGSLGYLAGALGPEGAAELRRLVFEVPRTFLAPQTYASYEGLATHILREGRAAVVSFGVVLSLWTASRAVHRFVSTIGIAYNLEDPRPLWRRRLLAFWLTLGALAVGVAILPGLVLGPRLVGLLASAAAERAAQGVLDAVLWPGMVLLALAALTCLYHFGAPWHTPWRRDLPGAVLALVLWVLAAVGLRVYIAVSLGGGSVFQPLATPIAVTLWAYVTAFAVLLGAEFNAEIEKRWPHERFPWHLARRPAPS